MEENTNLNLQQKKKLVQLFLESGTLVNSDFLSSHNFDENNNDPPVSHSGVAVMTKDKLSFGSDISGISEHDHELDRLKVNEEKGRSKHIYTDYISNLKKISESKNITKNKTNDENSNVKLVFSYNEKPKKREVMDFVNYFIARYRFMEKILKNRQELKSVTSISRVLQKKEKEVLSVIGMVKDRRETKNENLEVVVEDLTGEIKIIINKSKGQLFEMGQNLCFDEVIGIVGVNSNKVIFANNIILPDIPQKDIKKSEEETYALFLSDLHVGSKNFLREKFERFIKWLRLESGSEQQQHIAKNTKYIFIVGDLVDGVGIYPSQEADLEINDITKQYEDLAMLLKQIPERIKIIISGGNHDALRLAEPQPAFSNHFSASVSELPNVVMVSNPAVVNIDSSEKFSGFDVLLYHGYSFDHYIANVSSIRFGGGYDRADLVMKYLLQRRHLAPTHTSTPYIPDNEKDPLIIEQIPDFFVTGHLHKTSVAQYKSITMICGSCWQDITSFQIKVGHHPEPGRVPLVNLQTREMKILRF